jgi:hypothetical protein
MAMPDRQLEHLPEGYHLLVERISGWGVAVGCFCPFYPLNSIFLYEARGYLREAFSSKPRFSR